MIWDVVVAGGGVAGSATALAARRAGVARVLVCDRPRNPGPRAGESIPPDTRVLLARLGIEEEFRARADLHEPCVGSASAWAGADPAYNDFLFNPHGTGWHLDRTRFETWLAQRAGQAGAASCVSAVTRIVPEKGGWRVVRAGGEPDLRARVLIDATGGAAHVARALGVRRRPGDRFACLTAHIPAPPDLGRLSLLEAAPDGWWYMARTPGDRAVVCRAAEAQHIRQHGLHRREKWIAALRKTHLLGGLDLDGVQRDTVKAVVVDSVASTVLDQVSGPGWLAVGDAATRFDPIVSRGLHTALEDADRAGGLIAQFLGGDRDRLHRHQDAVTARYQEYLAVREHLYRTQPRWSRSLFWSRRRAASTPKIHRGEG